MFDGTESFRNHPFKDFVSYSRLSFSATNVILLHLSQVTNLPFCVMSFSLPLLISPNF